jgi:hypothetical protein
MLYLGGSDPAAKQTFRINQMLNGDLVMDGVGFTQLPESTNRPLRVCIVGQPEAPPERLVAILYMPMSGLLLDYGLHGSNPPN